MDCTPVFEVLSALRDPESGCPWDCEQTLESYAPYVVEEAQELAEAIASGNAQHVREEAGDLLWNLCFVILAAEERGEFNRDDVVRLAAEKMRRRHPHVFGSTKARSMEEAHAAFNRAKAAEQETKPQK